MRKLNVSVAITKGDNPCSFKMMEQFCLFPWNKIPLFSKAHGRPSISQVIESVSNHNIPRVCYEIPRPRRDELKETNLVGWVLKLYLQWTHCSSFFMRQVANWGVTSNNPFNKIHITFTFQEMAKEGHGATKFIGGHLTMTIYSNWRK